MLAHPNNQQHLILIHSILVLQVLYGRYRTQGHDHRTAERRVHLPRILKKKESITKDQGRGHIISLTLSLNVD